MGNSYWSIFRKEKSLHVSDREQEGDRAVLAVNHVLKEEWKMWQLDGLADNVMEWRIT
jgi:hypothetical protein